MKKVKDNNYIMHSTYNEHFKLLTDAELGRLIRDVNNYVENGVLPQYSNEERVLNMAFSFMKATIDIEKEKYQEKCKKNKENGSRGGRPKNEEKPNGFENNQTQPNGFNENPIDIDMEIGIDNDIDNKKSVCNKNAHAKNITCHLGSKYKEESCFYCMKKNLCKNKDSPSFKFAHPNETFSEWNKKLEQRKEEVIKELESMGKNPDIELIDYDWLNEDLDT